MPQYMGFLSYGMSNRFTVSMAEDREIRGFKVDPSGTLWVYAEQPSGVHFGLEMVQWLVVNENFVVDLTGWDFRDMVLAPNINTYFFVYEERKYG